MASRSNSIVACPGAEASKASEARATAIAGVVEPRSADRRRAADPRAAAADVVVAVRSAAASPGVAAHDL